MSLARIVFYTRNMTKDAGGSHADVVKGILSSCSKHDNASGITGALLFDRRYFLQTMEGDRTLLTNQLKNIAIDERQSGLTLMSFSAIEKREFLGWTVGYAGHEETIDRLYLSYGLHPEFDPTRMSEHSAVRMLHDFCSLESKYVQRSIPLSTPNAPVALVRTALVREQSSAARGLS
jgi:Sensors of blue-light using FAD